MRYCVCLFLLVCFTIVDAQEPVKDSLTFIQDTSYTLRVAFEKALKAEPEAAYPILNTDQVRVNVFKRKGLNGDSTSERILVTPASARSNNGNAIMIIHGGGWRSGSPDQHLMMAIALARKGYVCVLPYYRLSTHAQYPVPVYELKGELQWMAEMARKYKYDKDRISVAGFSAGGMLASLLATTWSGDYLNDLFRKQVKIHSLINIDGSLSFVHPESGEGDDSKKLSAATMWLGYKKADRYSLWEEASPLSHVSSHTPPSLFINSGVERMHAGRADFLKVLNEFNIYHEVHTFEDAPHHFPFFEPWFTPMIHYIDDFLKKVDR